MATMCWYVVGAHFITEALSMDRGVSCDPGLIKMSLMTVGCIRFGHLTSQVQSEVQRSFIY